MQSHKGYSLKMRVYMWLSLHWPTAEGRNAWSYKWLRENDKYFLECKWQK